MFDLARLFGNIDMEKLSSAVDTVVKEQKENQETMKKALLKTVALLSEINEKLDKLLEVLANDEGQASSLSVGETD